jgi:hypothetical protein
MRVEDAGALRTLRPPFVHVRAEREQLVGREAVEALEPRRRHQKSNELASFHGGLGVGQGLSKTTTTCA